METLNITGNEPAMPIKDEACGLTIRQQFAMAAMQGMLANANGCMTQGSSRSFNPETLATCAVNQADALITELNKQKTIEMEGEESNRVIAEFMGVGSEYKFQNIAARDYHTSWDWLMPVVEKIERIKGVHFVISELGCDIYSFGYKVSDTREETKILTIYKAVVAFIYWYNEQALGK